MRSADQLGFEQAYFDEGARNRPTVEYNIWARKLQPIDMRIARTRDAQNYARREYANTFRLNFKKRAYFQEMDAFYRQEEQDALQERAQAVNELSSIHQETLTGPDFRQANKSAFQLSHDAITHNDHSALTGSGNPPNIKHSRKYDKPGGLRKPLPMHQADLERQFPYANGRPVRAADPRNAAYLGLMNDGGPGADPLRGVNCLDCSLSFLETYVHGRPTVSAPRTADSYGFGEADFLEGEKDGHYRAEDATGSGFTSLTQRWLPGDSRSMTDIKAEVDAGFQQIIDTLKMGGHGSAAIIINVWEGNTAHAWNAVNHNGEIVFVDPQTGEYTDFTNNVTTAKTQFSTHYGHSGVPDRNNVVELNALMVDGQGNPMSVPNTQQSPHYSRRPTPPPPLAWQQQQTQLQHQQTTPLPPPPPPPVPGPTPPPPPPPVTTQPQPDPTPPVNTQPEPDPVVDTRPDRTPQVDTQPDPDSVVDTRDDTTPPGDEQPGSDIPPQAETTSTDPSPVQDQSTPDPRPKISDFDRMSVLDPDSMNRPPKDDPFAVLDLSPNPPVDTEPDVSLADSRDTPAPPPPAVDREAERQAKNAYHFELDSKRQSFDAEYRANLARDLRRQATDKQDAALEHARRHKFDDAMGTPEEIAQRQRERDDMAEEAALLFEQANTAENGGSIGDVELTDADWRRANETWAETSPGPVETDDRSALTGDGNPPPIDRNRPYWERGGLRQPLQIHQTDLERAMPRDQDGRVIRLADPREGDWFGLQNDGGPEADPTRSNNCGDNALSFYESYMHARPRVSAPRTFDGYHNGDVNRPIDPEKGVTKRIESTTGAEFEGLVDVGDLSPEDARNELRLAESRLRNHLLSTGHGSFAFITTQDQAGNTHVHTAVNQNGTVLYLDPQKRTVSENHPLYTHSGQGHGLDVVRMDALTLDGQNRPRPLHTLDTPFIATDPGGASSGPSPDPSWVDPAWSEEEKEQRLVERYELLGDEPPKFVMDWNDATYESHGAHTVERHGPDIELSGRSTFPTGPGDPEPVRTIEGRIYGDPPWSPNPDPESLRTSNRSSKWVDVGTMNRVLNSYIRENWEDIRSDLAEEGRHKNIFAAPHLVGIGFYNVGMGGVGPRQAVKTETRMVSISMKVVDGSHPPEPFIITTFPLIITE